jgi:hypothetical protein
MEYGIVVINHGQKIKSEYLSNLCMLLLCDLSCDRLGAAMSDGQMTFLIDHIVFGILRLTL